MAASKILLRGFQTIRRFSSSRPLHGDPDPVAGAAAIKLWKRVLYFVAFPAIGLCMINAYIGEKEHMEHYVRPEFIPYEHLRIQRKKFPWGDGNHTLFHNPKYNPLPDGYEDIEEDD